MSKYNLQYKQFGHKFKLLLPVKDYSKLCIVCSNCNETYNIEDIKEVIVELGRW